MAAVKNTKPLFSRTAETMKPGDKIKADTGEDIGLRVKCVADQQVVEKVPEFRKIELNISIR